MSPFRFHDPPWAFCTDASCRRRAARGEDPLQLPLREETNGLAVGPPEGQCCAIRARQGLRGHGSRAAGSRAVSCRRRWQRTRVAGRRARSRTTSMARWWRDDLQAFFRTGDVADAQVPDGRDREHGHARQSQRRNRPRRAARGAGPARPRHLRRHPRAARRRRPGSADRGCLNARSMTMRASPIA